MQNTGTNAANLFVKPLFFYKLTLLLGENLGHCLVIFKKGKTMRNASIFFTALGEEIQLYSKASTIK